MTGDAPTRIDAVFDDNAAGATMSGRWRRDRRGHGIRGPLFPPGAPAHRTATQKFDDLVLDAAQDIDLHWSDHLRGTQFAVEDVPPSDPAPWEAGRVPMGRYFPAQSGQPPRIVVYRKPIEMRAIDQEDLAYMVRDVLVEHVAHLLARTPQEIDPHFGDR